MDYLSKQLDINLQDLNYQNQKFEQLKNLVVINNKQCFFINNCYNREVVFNSGIQNMLGFTEAEFNLGGLTNKIHPEDKVLVNRIDNAAFYLALKTNFINNKSVLTKSFRVKKRNGTFLKVISLTIPFQLDQAGKLLSYLTILTDISFMNTKDSVKWEILSDKFNISLFKQKIYSDFLDLFTNRELEIIKLIKDGLTTKKISLKLHISPHTVVFHRKNIFKKSNCHSVKELITFCEKNGIK